MRILSSAVILVLLLGSCGLKAPIYIPKDPSRCLGCSVDAWFNVVKKKRSTLEGQVEPPGKEKS